MEVVAYGKPVDRIGNRHPFVTPFDLFKTSDKDIALCAGNDRLFGQLCKVLGRPDLIADPRFRSNQHRTENHVALKYELESGSQEADRRTLAAGHSCKLGVPVGPIMNVLETAEHPQTKARNMLVEAGGVRVSGNPIKILGYEDPPTRAPAPALDQHGDVIASRICRSFTQLIPLPGKGVRGKMSSWRISNSLMMTPVFQSSSRRRLTTFASSLITGSADTPSSASVAA